MKVLDRLGAARVASGAAVVVAVLLVGAFLVAAVRGGVETAAWVGAAGLAAMVGAGLLYAWRLGAYGDTR